MGARLIVLSSASARGDPRSQSLEQFLDRGVVGHGQDFAGKTVDKAQFAQVEQVVQNGGR